MKYSGRTGSYIALMSVTIFIFSSTIAQPINFKWAKQFAGNDYGYGKSVSVDNSGNVYTTGFFNGTVDFDPGPGVHALSAVQYNIYISKLDASGNFLWAKQLVSTSPGDNGFGIAVDAMGSAYVTGYFYETVDFDPGPGVHNMTAPTTGFGDAFILKLDASGNFEWVQQITGNLQELGYSLTLDVSANIYITGLFAGTTDFDPGPGSYNLTAAGSTDIFVVKLNANGQLVWAKRMGGSDSDEGHSIFVDQTGEVCITGIFRGSADFDPGAGILNLTSSGDKDIFVAKMNALGDLLWVRQIGGASEDESTSIVTDNVGNIYVGGYFWGTTDFDPGTGIINFSSVNNDYSDLFILKLDGLGNLVWARKIGGDGWDRVHGLTIDNDNNLYSTGLFGESIGGVDFDTGPGVYTLNALGGWDCFVLKMDNSGNYLWAGDIGGNTFDQGNSIAVDAAKNIYTCGFFGETADFDPGTTVYNITSTAVVDIFVHKMSQCAAISFFNITATSCFVYTLNGQTYSSTGVYTQTLVNAAGCDSIITLNLTIGGSNTTNTIVSCDSYLWEGQTLTSSGFYSVTHPAADGCDSILNLNLTIKQSSVTNLVVSICDGESYAGYTSSGIYVDSYTGSNGCDSTRTVDLTVKQRSFSFLEASICEGQQYLGYTTAGTFYDTLLNAAGCDSIRTLNLFVIPKKVNAIAATICEGQSYFAGGVNQTTAGFYYDTLVSHQGCDSVIITNLSITPKPVPNLGADKSFCLGQAVTLDPGNYSGYVWHDLSTLPTFSATGTGSYWVTVTDGNNCTATDTIHFTGVVDPPRDFLKATDSICNYGTLEVIAPAGFTDYLWSTGSATATTTIQSPGEYTLRVMDGNGCYGLDTITVHQRKCLSGIIFPNAFTPNNDNLNDLFGARVFEPLVSFRLEIYDRNGQRVFMTSNPNQGWDGTLNGKILTSAVFVWQCTYQLTGSPPAFQKGIITLIR